MTGLGRDNSSQGLAELSIAASSRLIQRRELSPVELAQATLDRIERFDPTLHAFITVTPERMLEDAMEAEREIASGVYRGPLHGITVAHKDTIFTQGVRTTGHSRPMLEFVPQVDSPVVAAWSGAGAVCAGKTNTYEFATGRDHTIFGIPRNPWNPQRVTGGSSSGSACALAACLVQGASGTDSGGSVRAPAFYCGVVGYRPSLGLIANDGLLSHSWSVDTVGLLARTAEDVSLLLEPLLSSDGQRDDRYLLADIDPEYLKDVRIGVPHEFYFDAETVEPGVLHGVQDGLRAMEQAGSLLLESEIRLAWATDSIFNCISPAENAHHCARYLANSWHELGYLARVSLKAGLAVTARDYLLAQELRRLFIDDFRNAFEGCDLLVVPTANKTAKEPLADELERKPQFRRQASLAGCPAVSVPCGFSPDGLPVGLQIIGPRGSDDLVLKAAWAFQQLVPVPTIAPESHYSAAGPELAMPEAGRDTESAIRERADNVRRELHQTAAMLASPERSPPFKFDFNSA